MNNSVDFQRAENGALDLSWLNFAFLGRPGFQSRGLKILFLKGFRASGRKIGAPQNRENQPRRIQPPSLGPLRIDCGSNPFLSSRGFCSHLFFPTPCCLLAIGSQSKLLLDQELSSCPSLKIPGKEEDEDKNSQQKQGALLEKKKEEAGQTKTNLEALLVSRWDVVV